MKKLLVAFVLFCVGSCPCQGTDEVRINVLSLLIPEELSISTQGVAILEMKDSVEQWSVTEDLHISIKIASDRQITVTHKNKSVIASNLVIQPRQDSQIHVKVLARNPISRIYYGKLLVDSTDSTLRLILHKDREDYIISAALTEFGYSAEAEHALLAGIVCIRSYVLNMAEYSTDEPFDFYDHTGNMFFTGADSSPESSTKQRIDQLTKQVEGYVLTYGNNIIPGFFSASCGGHTLDSSRVWGEGRYDKALVGVQCPWCNDYENQSWARNLSQSALLSALGLEAGNYNQLQIKSVDETLVHILDGTTLIKEVTTEQLRIAIGREHGWKTIPGNRFLVIHDGKILVLAGSGRGHGVGLCQVGAKNQALQGRTWKQILRFYFPRCELFRLTN